ncbi:MAG: hypothetical protein ACKO0Z_22975, partial [Betaproteobacteria bacterium]
SIFPFYPSESSVFDMKKAFWPVDRLMQDIDEDCIFFAGSTPVMLDSDGSYGEIIPSLLGFCSCHERMAKAQSIELDTSPLIRLANRIQYSIPITENDKKRAKNAVNRMKSIFLATPVFIRKRAWLDECIDIQVSDMGLKEAA